jgi:hypothetical protein
MTISSSDELVGSLSTTAGDGLTLSNLAKTTKTSLNVSTGGSGSDAATGDTVSISDEARSLAAKAAGDDADTTLSGGFAQTAAADKGQGIAATQASGSDGESTTEKLRKKIQEIQQQIREAENDPTLSPEARRQKVQMLQNELLTLQSQLAQSGGSGGGGGGAGVPARAGGTSAEGFANSLT